MFTSQRYGIFALCVTEQVVAAAGADRLSPRNAHVSPSCFPPCNIARGTVRRRSTFSLLYHYRFVFGMLLLSQCTLPTAGLPPILHLHPRGCLLSSLYPRGCFLSSHYPRGCLLLPLSPYPRGCLFPLAAGLAMHGADRVCAPLTLRLSYYRRGLFITATRHYHRGSCRHQHDNYQFAIASNSWRH